MRNPLLRALLAAAVVGCSGTGPAEVVVSVPSGPPPVPSGEPVAPLGPLDPSLPGQSAAVASISVEALSEWMKRIARVMNPKELARLERSLNLAEGTLARGVAEASGLDTTRPASLALAGPDAKLGPLLETLSSGAGESPDKAYEILHAAMAGIDTAFHLRVVVPIRDAGEATRAARRALGALGLEEKGAPPGFDVVFASGSVSAGIAHDDAWLVVDLVQSGRGSKPGWPFRALTAIRARAPGGPHDDAPALAGAAFRARGVPTAFADVGFLMSLAKVDGALESVEPDMRAAIAREGLQESRRLFELARNPRGAYCSAIEVSFSPPILGQRAKFGSARCILGPSWKDGTKKLPGRDAAGFEAVDAAASLDTATATVFAFALPGDSAGGFGERRAFRRLLREAGWPGYFVASPAMVLSELGSPIRAAPDGFLTSDAVHKFERVGWIAPTGGEVFVGVLPAGTTAAMASCALAGTMRCGPEVAVAPGKPAVHRKSRWARLTKLGDRHVLLLGRNAKDVDGVHLVPGTGGASHVVFWPRRMRLGPDDRVLAELFPERYDVALSATDEAVEVTVEAR